VSSFRRPFVAGQFYEGDVEALKLQVESCFLNSVGLDEFSKVNFCADSMNRSVVGLICPHAGYMYSGSVAALGFFELALDGLPKTVVLLGPNHSGVGSGLSLMREGVWQTPFGSVEVDTVLADVILSKSDLIDVDVSAHLFEHSLEVQLPFLQYLYGGKKFKIVPICFLMQDYFSAVEVGNVLVEALYGCVGDVVVVASSDMSHYEPVDVAERKDFSVLDAVVSLDAHRFYRVVEANNVSVCGCGPIGALITFVKGVGAMAKLLGYCSSGVASGDYSSVVGYASVVFRRDFYA
jgi:AmmeMemoRadiSam system protein B